VIEKYIIMVKALKTLKLLDKDTIYIHYLLHNENLSSKKLKFSLCSK